jgi:hypothetical protein
MLYNLTASHSDHESFIAWSVKSEREDLEIDRTSKEQKFLISLGQ